MRDCKQFVQWLVTKVSYTIPRRCSDGMMVRQWVHDSSARDSERFGALRQSSTCERM